MTFVGQALSDKIAAGLTLQCDFCRTSFVGQNRCSTPVISGDLSDRLCKCKIRFRDHMVLSDNFPKEIFRKISFVGQVFVGQNQCSAPEISETL